MDPFVAEIRIFPFNFPPKGWARCDGQILPVSQNTALFSLLGIMYGGNGISNFALPDLQGRAPMHWGQGPGLSMHDIGETGGVEAVTLLQSDIPPHNHNFQVSRADAIEPAPGGQQFASGTGVSAYAVPGAIVQMANNAIAPAGGGLPHNNMQPYLTCYFNIALQGVFPSHG